MMIIIYYTILIIIIQNRGQYNQSSSQMSQKQQQPNKIKLTSILFFQPKTPQSPTMLKSNKSKQFDEHGHVRELAIVMVGDRGELFHRKWVIGMLGVRDVQEIGKNKEKQKEKEKEKEKEIGKQVKGWALGNVQIFDQTISLYYGYHKQSKHQDNLDLYQAYSSIISACPKLPHTKSTLILNDIATPVQPQIITNFIKQFNQSKTTPADEKNSLFMVLLPIRTVISSNSKNGAVSTVPDCLELKRNQENIASMFKIAKLSGILFVELINYCQAETGHPNNGFPKKQQPKPNIFEPAYEIILAWRSLISKSPSTLYKTYLRKMLNTITYSKLRIEELQKINASEVFQTTQIWISKVEQLYTIVKDIVGLCQKCMKIAQKFHDFIKNKQDLFYTKAKIQEFKTVLSVFNDDQSQRQQNQTNRMSQQRITNNNHQQIKNIENKQKINRIIAKLQQKYQQLQTTVQNDNKTTQQIKSQLNKLVLTFVQKATNLIQVYKQYSKDLKKQQKRKDNTELMGSNDDGKGKDKQKQKQQAIQQTDQINTDQNYFEDHIGNKVISEWEKQLEKKLKTKMKLQTKQFKRLVNIVQSTEDLIIKVMRSQEQMQIYEVVPPSIEEKPLSILINYFITKKSALFKSLALPAPVPLSSNLMACNELSSTILEPCDIPNPNINTNNDPNSNSLNAPNIKQPKQIELIKSISCPPSTIADKSKLVSTIADNNASSSLIQAASQSKINLKLDKNDSNISGEQNAESLINDQELNNQQMVENMNRIGINIMRMQESISQFRMSRLLNQYDGLEYNKFLLEVTKHNFRIFQSKQAEIKCQVEPKRGQQSLINTKKNSSKANN